MIAGSRHLAGVLAWKPLAVTATGTALWLALVERPTPLLLSVAAAAVAAATPFILDDSAGSTLQSSPATLRRRRAHRLALLLPVVALWWVIALLVGAPTTDRLQFSGYTLQFATLIGIGLAGASTVTSADSNRPPGGTIGALAVVICFGTAFLPTRPLQLVPADPAAPDARWQLIAVLAVAAAIQLAGSTDPARRTTTRLLRSLTPRGNRWAGR